jgi:hypothetical protein
MRSCSKRRFSIQPRGSLLWMTSRKSRLPQSCPRPCSSCGVMLLVESRRNVDLTKNQVDAFWTWVHAASDLLVSHNLPSIAHGPPNGTGEFHQSLALVYVRKTRIDEKERLFACPDTIASYYPFSLCLSAAPSTVNSRSLVGIWCAVAVGIQTFCKKETCAIFCRCEIDANYSGCRDTCRLACLYRGTFGQWTYFWK